MGIGSSSAAGRRRHRPPPPPPHPHQQPQIVGGRYPYPGPIPNPGQQYYQYGPNPNQAQFYQYSAFYPPPPNWVPGQYPYGAPPPPLPGAPFVEHQKAVTIKNDVNIRKESLMVEPDEENPGKFVVAFTFDATAPGSITIMFFTKEDADFKLIATKESLVKPVKVPFEKGLAQKFRQPSGTGIDFSMCQEIGLTKEGDTEVYPLVVKAQGHLVNEGECESDGNSAGNSQITQAVFEKKENGEYKVRVVKQILWVNKMRYELQEIYGIVNAVEGDETETEVGKECIVCLSEPRDTTVLPCRHMCMCRGCAQVLGYQTNRCPVCRQPVERLLEIKVNNAADGAVS